MDSEVKELLKKEIKLVNQSKFKVGVGVGLLLTNLMLVMFSLLDIYTLVFSIILLYIVWNQVAEYRINKMTLVLMRYIVDEEFAKEFDKEREEKENNNK